MLEMVMVGVVLVVYCRMADIEVVEVVVHGELLLSGTLGEMDAVRKMLAWNLLFGRDRRSLSHLRSLRLKRLMIVGNNGIGILHLLHDLLSCLLVRLRQDRRLLLLVSVHRAR